MATGNTQKLVKFGIAVFELGKQTDKQTKTSQYCCRELKKD